MTRLQWLLLALAVAAAAVLVGSWDRAGEGNADAGSGAGGGEPDLYMQNAVISQYDVAGNLSYRLKATAIAHFAGRRVTELTAPALTLMRGDGPPWIASAAHGEVTYTQPDNAAVGSSLLGSSLLGSAAPTPTRVANGGVDATAVAGEAIHLSNGVVLSRSDAEHFVRLTTSQLTLMTATRAAATNTPVLIVTDTGRTIASGMAGELETGRLQLFSDPRQRVNTIVNSLQP